MTRSVPIFDFLSVWGGIATWSLHDPQKIGSLPKISGSLTHFFRVMETPGIIFLGGGHRKGFVWFVLESN